MWPREVPRFPDEKRSADYIDVRGNDEGCIDRSREASPFRRVACDARVRVRVRVEYDIRLIAQRDTRRASSAGKRIFASRFAWRKKTPGSSGSQGGKGHPLLPGRLDAQDDRGTCRAALNPSLIFRLGRFPPNVSRQRGREHTHLVESGQADFLHIFSASDGRRRNPRMALTRIELSGTNSASEFANAGRARDVKVLVARRRGLSGEANTHCETHVGARGSISTAAGNRTNEQEEPNENAST